MQQLDPFDYPEKVTKQWPELGVSYFRLIMRKGFKKEYPPQVDGLKRSHNVTLLPVGALRTWNENRSGPLDVFGKPGRIAGGMLLPGAYTLEALEDSIYVCVSLSNLPSEFLIPENRMFELEPHSLDKWEEKSFSYNDNYRALFCAFGRIKIGDEIYTDGDSYILKEGETVSALAEVQTEVVAYKLKPQEA